MFGPRLSHLSIQALKLSSRPNGLHLLSTSRIVAVNSSSSYYTHQSSPPAQYFSSSHGPRSNSRNIKWTDSTENSPTEDDEGIARINENISIEYPDQSEVPRTPVIQGRGGMHFKRTLAQFSLEDRVTVVTGGASGIGLAMSQAIIASGSHVAIVDMNQDEAHRQAKTLLEQFKAENPGIEEYVTVLFLIFDKCPFKILMHDQSIPRVTAHYADVADPTSVNDSIAEIIATQGRIDHLVTCAGFTENFSAVSYPHDRMQRLWGVVVDGTYLFTTGVAKHLIERQAAGSMVVIGSMSGTIVNVPQPQAPYNAAKAAVRHLAASLAVEWASHDIRVNCISPGYILTALTKEILDENVEFRDKWISLIPAGKVGKPEDLMGAVVFLLSDSARYITGADLRVDGGYTLT
ncbi:hypothetical protein N7466_006397 [Penicillium verhagenii]|uniref:uncharacterized protein n=1 Tax=Penicillium verhagenii TaxID=1562060 RepID=UPI00254569C8|nr:uncharacterized protein N7466_006397 [Penicillium verhagenii]KAJ5930904.1 hypothetical protein N7466_006397 [Penicillium verhagenii]